MRYIASHLCINMMFRLLPSKVIECFVNWVI
nr:MAG TPA: hypothetical protein [Caudoviricetes sp.]